MKLIPNNISVSEQFARRQKFLDGVEKWCTEGHYWTFNTLGRVWCVNVRLLEQESGVRCRYIHKQYEYGTVTPTTLADFEIVNESQYVSFLLRWL